MTSIPQEMSGFLQENHVMSLATSDTDGVWSASAFYHADLSNDRLIFLTSVDTRHGRAMVNNPHVAGAVAGQPVEISAIKGIQFSGQAIMLTGSARDEALSLYLGQFPFAASHDAPVWALKIAYLKLTDNSKRFGHKLIWSAKAN